MCQSRLTFLAVVGIPAAVIVIVVEHGLFAHRIVFHDAWTNVTALFGLLVPGDVIVELCVHDERPVYGVQVAELWILLDANGPPGYVPQVVQTDVLQAGHLKDHQGVVIEKVTATDDR